RTESNPDSGSMTRPLATTRSYGGASVHPATNDVSASARIRKRFMAMANGGCCSFAAPSSRSTNKLQAGYTASVKPKPRRGSVVMGVKAQHQRSIRGNERVLHIRDE